MSGANVFKEGELEKAVVCKDFLHTTRHDAMGKKLFAFSKMEIKPADILKRGSCGLRAD